ncbi:MAG: hypothetical protein K6F25_06535, partial [Bacteroidales bacterium]|nr:hypothetical protein [Bacteroidales bacterium]
VSCTRPGETTGDNAAGQKEKPQGSAADGSETLLLTLRHPHGVVGTLELSTAYSWKSACESLSVCTSRGEYRLEGMDSLSFRPFQGKVLGIPLEKLRPRGEVVEYIYKRNGFNPVIADNQVVSAGYFDEIRAFVSAVEAASPYADAATSSPAPSAGRRNLAAFRANAKTHPVLTGFDDIRPTYRLLEDLRKRL